LADFSTLSVGILICSLQLHTKQVSLTSEGVIIEMGSTITRERTIKLFGAEFSTLSKAILLYFTVNAWISWSHFES
jgi:hypothetical protein